MPIDDQKLPDKWREKLIEAKAGGASDALAAQCAGLTGEELETLVELDPELDREMCKARAEALLKHIKAIADASQWQAHQYMLEKLWPEQFGPRPPAAAESRLRAELRVPIARMRAEETRRLPDIIELGLLAHRQAGGIGSSRIITPEQLALPCPTPANPSSKS